ncbi:unnamed protein product [Victoria cruziana]
MRILVAVKRVVDYAVKIRVKPDKTGVETTNVKMSMNPFCELALEEAVRIKESGSASEVVLVSMGDKHCVETLKSGLAMGADRGIHVSVERSLYPLSVSKLLKAIVAIENPGLLLLGKQAIDDDCNQTGQMVAGLLGWPQGTFVSKVVLDKQKRTAIVESSDLRLNQPRYATLPDIMKAKSKVIKTFEPADLNVEIKSDLEHVQVIEPPKRKAGVMVFSVVELIDKLENEAHVL